MSGLTFEHAPPAVHGADRTESALDRVRAAMGESKPGSQKHFDMPVPGRGVEMRFRRFDEDLYDELTESKDKDRHADFLAAACECILLPRESGDGFEPWMTDDGAFVKFDGSLSAAMGWSTESSRAEVLKMFEMVPQPRASIRGHAVIVDQFLVGLVEQREEDVLGES